MVLGKNFLAKLNFRRIPKTLLPKSFLQFETPRSLVLAPNPLPQSPQKFNSINAPYLEVTITNLSQKWPYIHTFSRFVPISTRTRDPWLKTNYMYVGSWLVWIRCSNFFAVLPVSWLPEAKTSRHFRNFLSWFQYFPSFIYNSRESKMLRIKVVPLDVPDHPPNFSTVL